MEKREEFVVEKQNERWIAARERERDRIQQNETEYNKYLLNFNLKVFRETFSVHNTHQSGVVAVFPLGASFQFEKSTWTRISYSWPYKRIAYFYITQYPLNYMVVWCAYTRGIVDGREDVWTCAGAIAACVCSISKWYHLGSTNQTDSDRIEEKIGEKEEESSIRCTTRREIQRD